MQIKVKHTFRLQLFAAIIGLLSFSQHVFSSEDVKEFLKVEYKNGGDVSSVNFAFDEQPVLTFDGETLYIKMGDDTRTFIIDDVVSMTFDSDVTTGVGQPLQTTSAFITFCYVHSGLIQVKGEDLDSEVTLHAADGRQMNVQTDFSKNEINIHIAALPCGLYIIQTNRHSFKFIKK